MTQLNPDSTVQELNLKALNRLIKVNCLGAEHDLSAAGELLDKTFLDMERLYELKYSSLPSAQDTSTWLLIGALNLAHRVVCLERGAAVHSIDMENPLSKLLDSIPDDVIPYCPTPDTYRPAPME